MESRARQTTEERVLQAQFISRIAFVSSQLKDLEFEAHRRIIGIGNDSAECISAADEALQLRVVEIGEFVMEIAAIARKDFMRIPTEFVHPLIEETEQLSQSFLNVVMSEVGLHNVIFDFTETVNSLEEHLEESSQRLLTVRDDINADFAIKRRQMDYVKAEIFPLLEYALIYFQQDADEILADLETCTQL